MTTAYILMGLVLIGELLKIAFDDDDEEEEQMSEIIKIINIERWEVGDNGIGPWECGSEKGFQHEYFPRFFIEGEFDFGKDSEHSFEEIIDRAVKIIQDQNESKDIGADYIGKEEILELLFIDKNGRVFLEND